MKMLKGILQQEGALEDQAKVPTNYHRLVQRLSNKTKHENDIKKEKHVMKKRFVQSKVQPGAHQNLLAMSDFNIPPKPEFLQFFGATDCKIAENNFVANKNYAVGPGAYNLYASSFKETKRANTANFTGGRKDVLFAGNNNPGPQQYQPNQGDSITSKPWSTNIGAFGTTEKKFASIHAGTRASAPGPGTY